MMFGSGCSTYFSRFIRKGAIPVIFDVAPGIMICLSRLSRRIGSVNDFKIVGSDSTNLLEVFV
jgi:hypothetical protein